MYAPHRLTAIRSLTFCATARMMMQAIRETKVNMSVYLGVYMYVPARALLFLC